MHRHSSAYSCPLSSEREFNAPVPVCQGKVRCFRAWFRHRSFLPFLLRGFCDFLMIEVVADHGRLTEGARCRSSSRIYSIPSFAAASLNASFSVLGCVSFGKTIIPHSIFKIHHQSKPHPKMQRRDPAGYTYGRIFAETRLVLLGHSFGGVTVRLFAELLANPGMAHGRSAELGASCESLGCITRPGAVHRCSV